MASDSPESAISEEEFLGLNTLVEDGQIDKLEAYIDEKSIIPQNYYQYFKSHYVYGRLCAVGLAAKCGHLEVMKKLISLGFSVNEKASYFGKLQPIHLACEAGSVAVVKSLVEDYDVNISDRDICHDRSPMCLAAEHGRLDIVQYFVEEGTDVNSKYGIHGTTALHSAAEHNQVEICRYLLSKGANADLHDGYNVTPLIVCARNNSVATARILLDAGADVNYEDEYWQSPFHNAVSSGHMDMIKFLASRGADPETDDRYDHNSPLHLAAEDNRFDIAEYLVLELNISLVPDEDWHETPFRLSLREKRHDIIDLLVRAGYNPVDEVEEFYDDSEDEGQGDDVTFRSKTKKSRRVGRSSEWQERLKELKHVVSNPRSLQALCVYTVRRLLGRRLSSDVDRLPVCEPIKQKIKSCDVAVL